ncbi:class I SAM-dependent methyltransferase [uncultured Sphaerotilus sp.]|uniref:class I SAM-dependent methyltransferase n=1 Tax=uncultured Sphaerotilus sp. TaxID=474984 RepID=UPI0030CA1BA4
MNQPLPLSPAEMYERHFVPAMFRPWSALLLRHAAIQPGARVLDVACGTGIVAREAAPLVGEGGQVVALDMNPAMLAVGRSLPAPAGAAIDWREGNAMALPFADRSFDTVLCQHGLQFFPDRVGALREIRRVLATGGRVQVMVLQALALHPVFEVLMTAVAHHLELPIDAVMTPFDLPESEALRTLLVASGFPSAEVLPVSTTVRFPDAERFVPLAVASSAAAVPAFAQLTAPARAALLDAVRLDVEPMVARYRDAGGVAFPMWAHVGIGRI